MGLSLMLNHYDDVTAIETLNSFPAEAPVSSYIQVSTRALRSAQLSSANPANLAQLTQTCVLCGGFDTLSLMGNSIIQYFASSNYIAISHQ